MSAKYCVAVVIGALLIPFSVLGQTRPDWEAEWKQTEEAAKKEGKLSIFLFQRDNIETAVRAFNKKYPDIKITTVATSAPQTGPRIMAERRANKYLWDICICGPTTPYRTFYRANALDPLKPHLILPEVRDESKWWGGKHFYLDPEGQYIFVYIGNISAPSIYYNKKLVQPNEVNSYWDLVDPKWKGKMISIDPTRPGRQRVGARVLYHMPDLGPEFLRKFYGEMDVALSRNDRQAMDWLAVGKYSICILCGRITDAKAQGLPLDEFETVRWKENRGLSSGSNGTLVLMNRAPHPNAAKLFINWHLSREGQMSFQKIMNTADVEMESMRIDIPKDVVPEAYRRKKGVEYIVMDTPERGDNAPVGKLLKSIIRKK
ncbi:MAG: extracellular solute-binding protein [Deltaproteobacteria bacterium]|nr:extracellular solute-binding protein [Deltaproteobacteria bacterium]